MNVKWLNDNKISTIGGSSTTSKLMILEGSLRGHAIEEVDASTLTVDLSERALTNFFGPVDVVILNNINQFKREVVEWVIKNTRYVKYEHDYCFTEKRDGVTDGCPPAPLFIDLFSNSLLNIFFSPLQLNIFRDSFGETVRDAITIPAPLQADTWSPNPIVQKEVYLYAGLIATHKGLNQILDFADSVPDKEFHFAGPVVNDYLLKRIEDKHVYLGEIPHEEMPLLMSKYKYFIINPQMPESFGLTIVEALMSGCEIVRFSRSQTTGFESYNYPKAVMFKKCLAAPKTFWTKIEQAMKK